MLAASPQWPRAGRRRARRARRAPRCDVARPSAHRLVSPGRGVRRGHGREVGGEAPRDRVVLGGREAPAQIRPEVRGGAHVEPRLRAQQRALRPGRRAVAGAPAHARRPIGGVVRPAALHHALDRRQHVNVRNWVGVCLRSARGAVVGSAARHPPRARGARARSRAPHRLTRPRARTHRARTVIPGTGSAGAAPGVRRSCWPRTTTTLMPRELSADRSQRTA